MTRRLAVLCCAGIGVGVFDDATQAVSTCVRLARHITPSMENHEKYKRYFKIYKGSP